MKNGLSRFPRVSRAFYSGGFTLIELLVVIAVIIVLLSLLLAGMSAARNQSQRTTCMSNLRQIYTSLNLYAVYNDGLVPAGYVGGNKQSNYIVYYRNVPTSPTRGFVSVGRLYVQGLMTTPQAFYCPSQALGNSTFDSVGNPWPPGVNTASNTRIGYGIRTTHPANPSVGLSWSDDGGTTTWFPANLPRWDQFRGKALIADLISSQPFMTQCHQNGINVLYANGSARWVDRKVIEKGPNDLNEIEPGWSAAQNNANQDEIWKQLDAY